MVFKIFIMAKYYKVELTKQEQCVVIYVKADFLDCFIAANIKAGYEFHIRCVADIVTPHPEGMPRTFSINLFNYE